jgi:hypothetical protein
LVSYLVRELVNQSVVQSVDSSITCSRGSGYVCRVVFKMPKYLDIPFLCCLFRAGLQIHNVQVCGKYKNCRAHGMRTGAGVFI